MAFAYSSYAWSLASAGIRTPIFKGPLWHAAPVQWLLFAREKFGQPSLPLTFSVVMYSAAAPWYYNASGTATAWPNFAVPAPPSYPIDPLPPVNIGKAPWDAGYPIWALASPYVEVYVTASVTCMASLFVP
jgi:hypothetical protein